MEKKTLLGSEGFPGLGRESSREEAARTVKKKGGFLTGCGKRERTRTGSDQIALG